MRNRFVFLTCSKGVQTGAGALMHELYIDRDFDVVHLRQGRTLGSAGLTRGKHSPPFLCPLERRYQSGIRSLGSNEQLRSGYQKIDVMFFTQIPTLIFFLNIVDIVLFSFFHLKITTSPFKIKITYDGIPESYFNYDDDYEAESVDLACDQTSNESNEADENN
ncbi:hypothetical protein RF11_15265 [Thelohanellus kitauei]|uniref:Uncharacterized protein n=1 Tax=Thelohanellus kitauei TaxID=669202 RepID=A0A0C2MYS5_THEKT|nr:hypothetical protein RF11_15265 [Thelohanellus kitauei]